MVLCIGDSLTLGVMGYSYIPFLRREERIVNLGVNGDSLWGGTRRLRSCLKKANIKVQIRSSSLLERTIYCFLICPAALSSGKRSADCGICTAVSAVTYGSLPNAMRR